MPKQLLSRKTLFLIIAGILTVVAAIFLSPQLFADNGPQIDSLESAPPTNTIQDNSPTIIDGVVAPMDVVQNGYPTPIPTSTPIPINCSNSQWDVDSEAGLNDAISCFNDAPAGDYTIAILGNIWLTANTLTINNDQSAKLQISGLFHALNGNQIAQILHIQSGDVTIEELTLRNGIGRESNTICVEISCGGAIINSGTLTLKEVILHSNSAYQGGALYNNGGTALITNSNITDNSADGGGGIYNRLGEVSVIDSYIADNDATDGGGITNRGDLIITDTTITANNAFGGIGGGIVNWHEGEAEVNRGTINYNHAQESGGGIANFGSIAINSGFMAGNASEIDGGGIYVHDDASLNTTSLVLHENRAGQSGGGIYVGKAATVSINQLEALYHQGDTITSLGNLTITDSAFIDNSSSALYVASDSTTQVSTSHFINNNIGIISRGVLTVTESTVSNNYGRGISLNFPGKATILRSTISNNSTLAEGGGIFSDSADLTIINSTVSGNYAQSGGGLFIVDGAAHIINSTITNNTATSNETGAGIHFISGAPSSNGAVTLQNTIIANNTGDTNCGGSAVIADSSNLDSDDSCDDSTTVPTSEIYLGPLQDNGGPTHTHAIVGRGAAFNGATDHPDVTTDQRGVARPQNSAPDIGAFELALDNCPEFPMAVSDESELNQAIYCFNFAPAGDYEINIVDDIVMYSTPHPVGGAPSSKLSINGNNYIVDGDYSFRPFTVQNSHVTISNLTIYNGYASIDDCADGRHACGGGVYVGSSATVSITRSIITDNHAIIHGGGVYNNGTLFIDQSTLTLNATYVGIAHGGGVYNYDGTVTIQNSTLSSNSGNWDGGGFYNYSGTAFIHNSTIYNNDAPYGGGVYNRLGEVQIENSLISSNTSEVGSPQADCFNSAQLFVSEKNIDTDGSCGAAETKTAAEINLGPLQNNGGPTLTHALLAGSVAIDAATADPDITTDQRGVARPQGGAPDIGAFEFVETDTDTQITIVVETTPFNSGVDFRFGGDLGSFKLDNAGGNDGDTFTNSQTFTVEPGSYTIKEIEYARWELLDISCSGDEGTIDLENLEVTLDVAAGEQITCTFLNERASFINARKVNDVNGSGNYQSGEPFMADWEIEVYDSDNQFVTSDLTDADGRVSIKVKAGDYTVCEVPQDGWSATRPTQINPTFGQPCYSVSLLPKRIGWMRFFNTQSSVRAMIPADHGHSADVLYTWDDEPEDESASVGPFANNPFEETESKTTTIYLPMIGR